MTGRGPGGSRDGGWRDRGSGTVLLVGVTAVAVVLLAAVGLLVGAQRARSTAQAAADLAALAAATHLTQIAGPRSDTSACAVAAEVAARNGAAVLRCTSDGAGVVTVTATHRAAGAGVARATARAGPASARASP